MTVNMDHVFAEVKAWIEEGFCHKELEPSFLGLDWVSFGTRKPEESESEWRLSTPPEFIYCGFSALDAYASAMLAGHFSFAALGALTFKCKLVQHDPENGLRLELATFPERGRIDPERIMVELLRSFPELLRAKGIESGSVSFLEGEGCMMECEYPGRMVAKASPFLRNRSVEHWPEAMLTLMPTDELRIRAQRVLDFLRSSEISEGNPN